MKILVTGAYSTGKSTFSAKLVEALQSEHGENRVSLVKGVARSSGLNLNLAQNAETTAWLLGAQIERERIASSNPASRLLVCDRGVPDILAHNRDAAARGRGLNDEAVIERAVKWCATYDLVFFSKIDPLFPVVDDGLRVVDDSYRAKMESFAIRTLKNCRSVFELPSGSEERLVFVLSKLKALAGGRS